MTHQGHPIVRGDWPIIVLLAVSVALWVLGDYQRAGPGAQLFPFGASGVAWYVLGLMLVAWVASRTSQPQVPYRQSLFLLALCAPLAVGLVWASSLVASVRVEEALLATLLVTGAAVLAWGLRRVSGQRQLLAVWMSAMAAIGLAWASTALYVRPTVWYVAEPEDARQTDSLRNGEDLLFEQPEAIDRAVGQLAAREPGRPNAFFVGFAGFGAQKVFAQEIELALNVIGSRFGSTSRSVRLVNDERGPGELPLATAAGLRRTLLAVGKRMDLASDVLFLVLSSHGSEDGRLVVQNSSLPLQPLSPSGLAYALREAGIKWKVVVISACFSGAFVDALKDDYSVILTAAAPDRASFGCSDHRDLTYFGEAFFRNALPGASSLREAFAEATEEIRSREQEEGMEPSRPQAFFGAAAEGQIAALRKALIH
jgi:hypothetical protein